METHKILKSKSFKIVVSLFIVYAIILLVKSGHHFGQWLQHTIN